MDTELTMGDKNQEANVALGDSNQTTNTAEQIGDKVTAESIITNVSNIDPLYMLLMIAGWILPSPTNIYVGIKLMFLGFFSGLKSFGRGIIELVKAVRGTSG